MSRKFKRPSAALIVAVLALFVALGGSAVAAGVVPLAKRALSADNAKKLQGKTAAQVAALAPAPPPVSSIRGLVSVKTAAFSLGPQSENLFGVTCDGGAKAMGAGFDNPTSALVINAGTKLNADGTGWIFDLVNTHPSVTAAGTVIITCLT